MLNWQRLISVYGNRPSRIDCRSGKQKSLFYQPVSFFSISAKVKAQQNFKLFTRPRPIITIQNWLYSVLVNGYHRVDFNLADFCASCPFVVEQILQSLANNDTQHLNEAIDVKCLENLIQNWNDLTPNAKQFLSNLNSHDIYHRYPTIRMRLPEKINPSKELTSFLNIHLQIYFSASPKDMMPMSDREMFFKNVPFPMEAVKLPVTHYFQFEREITRGVDDSWKLMSCGSFPSAAFIFSKLS